MSTQPCIFKVLDMFLQQIFSSLEIRLNASSKSRKLLYFKHLYTLTYPPLTSILPSQRGTIGSPRCLGCVFRFVRSRGQVNSGFYGYYLFAGTGQWFLSVRGNKSIYCLIPPLILWCACLFNTMHTPTTRQVKSVHIYILSDKELLLISRVSPRSISSY